MGEPLKQGWLQKADKSGGNWYKRFCVAVSGELRYYPDTEMQATKDPVNLSKARFYRGWDLTRWSPTEHIFRLVMDSRDFYFCCTTAAELDEWEDAIINAKRIAEGQAPLPPRNPAPGGVTGLPTPTSPGGFPRSASAGSGGPMPPPGSPGLPPHAQQPQSTGAAKITLHVRVEGRTRPITVSLKPETAAAVNMGTLKARMASKHPGGTADPSGLELVLRGQDAEHVLKDSWRGRDIGLGPDTDLFLRAKPGSAAAAALASAQAEKERRGSAEEGAAQSDARPGSVGVPRQRIVSAPEDVTPLPPVREEDEAEEDSRSAATSQAHTAVTSATGVAAGSSRGTGGGAGPATDSTGGESESRTVPSRPRAGAEDDDGEKEGENRGDEADPDGAAVARAERALERLPRGSGVTSGVDGKGSLLAQAAAEAVRQDQDMQQGQDMQQDQDMQQEQEQEQGIDSAHGGRGEARHRPMDEDVRNRHIARRRKILEVFESLPGAGPTVGRGRARVERAALAGALRADREVSSWAGHEAALVTPLLQAAASGQPMISWDGVVLLLRSGVQEALDRALGEASQPGRRGMPSPIGTHTSELDYASWRQGTDAGPGAVPGLLQGPRSATSSVSTPGLGPMSDPVGDSGAAHPGSAGPSSSSNASSSQPAGARAVPASIPAALSESIGRARAALRRLEAEGLGRTAEEEEADLARGTTVRIEMDEEDGGGGEGGGAEVIRVAPGDDAMTVALRFCEEQGLPQEEYRGALCEALQNAQLSQVRKLATRRAVHREELEAVLRSIVDASRRRDLSDPDPAEPWDKLADAEEERDRLLSQVALLRRAAGAREQGEDAGAAGPLDVVGAGTVPPMGGGGTSGRGAAQASVSEELVRVRGYLSDATRELEDLRARLRDAEEDLRAASRRERVETRLEGSMGGSMEGREDGLGSSGNGGFGGGGAMVPLDRSFGALSASGMSQGGGRSAERRQFIAEKREILARANADKRALLEENRRLRGLLDPKGAAVEHRFRKADEEIAQLHTEKAALYSARTHAEQELQSVYKQWEQDGKRWGAERHRMAQQLEALAAAASQAAAEGGRAALLQAQQEGGAGGAAAAVAARQVEALQVRHERERSEWAGRQAEQRAQLGALEASIRRSLQQSTGGGEHVGASKSAGPAAEAAALARALAQVQRQVSLLLGGGGGPVGKGMGSALS